MKKIYLLALIMAIIAGLSVYLFAMSLQDQAQRQDEDTEYVVVAAAAIAADTLITSDMLTVSEMPVQAIHAQAIRSLTDAVGKINQYPLAVGEQLLLHRVKEKTEHSDRLSYALEPGYRAITLSVDLVTGVSGYIAQGDHVDLIVNITVENSNVSRFQVENLLVLRLGEKKPAGEQGGLYGTITLAATPEQVLLINHGMNNGRISLVLRAITDRDIDAPDPVSEAIIGGTQDQDPTDSETTDQEQDQQDPANADSIEEPDAESPDDAQADDINAVEDGGGLDG